ncbi:MAG: hypothetical protein ACTHMV_12905 [Chitinophagaceae bacterium]
MKKIILYSALAIAAFTGCRKIETDGEKEIVIVPGGGNGGPTGETITLKGRITSDTILRKTNTYILQGKVYVTNGAKMTVEAGTVIKGTYSGAEVAALIIARGSQIIAQGTANEPIIFTSNSPNPRSGDWGGIVLLGKASINTTYTADVASVYPNNPNVLLGAGTFQIEGGVDNTYGEGVCGGGTNPVNNDNSGVLSYVRIEYAGYAFIPDKEINSLTMGAVGSGTTIDHVQVTYAKDDAYEWFGGTVNCKYLVAYRTQDDDFDTDNGYSGTVQFGLIVRDSANADVSNSEAFESDNNSTGTTATPKTSAIFSNVTAIGPRATLANVGNNYFLAAAQIRRNSAISIFNSVFMGWPRGLLIDASTGTPTDLNIGLPTGSGELKFKNNIIAGCGNHPSFPAWAPVKYSAGTNAAAQSSDAEILAWVNLAENGNQIITNNENVGYTRPFDYINPDFTPFGSGSVLGQPNPIINGYAFTDAKLANNAFIDKTVKFRGAISPSGDLASWYKGWCVFN